MKVLIGEYFDKDTDKISDKKVLFSLADFIENLSTVDRLSEIKHCKKLKGHKSAYRIKIGQFRVGFIFENQTRKLIRFLPRKNIYLHFPVDR